MEKKFKETTIPEDYSRILSKRSFLLGPSHVFRIATVLFHGVSSCLANIKNVSVPKAVVFRSIDHSFLAGAMVTFVPNTDDPSNPASGRWDYVWTFYEDDLKGADCLEVSNNTLLSTFFVSSGATLYNMKFQSPDVSILLMTVMIEMIITWLKENATETEPVVLSLGGVFKATATVEDGKTFIGIVPDGEMKVLIKDDSQIQEL